MAIAAGKLVNMDSPPEDRRGRRKTYIALPEAVPNAPNGNGATDTNMARQIDAPPAKESEIQNATSNAPPYREITDGALDGAVPVPIVPSIAPSDNGALSRNGAIDKEADDVEVEI